MEACSRARLCPKTLLNEKLNSPSIRSFLATKEIPSSEHVFLRENLDRRLLLGSYNAEADSV